MRSANPSPKKLSLALAIGIVAAAIPLAITVSNDAPRSKATTEISPQGFESVPATVTATWTRPSTHSNSPYFYYRIEFSEGVAGLTPEDFSYSGNLTACTFSPSKGELADQPSLGVDYAEYATVYNVMISCQGTSGSITPRISGEVAVPFDDVGVVNEPIDVDRSVAVVSDPILTVNKLGDGDGYVSSTTSSFQCGELCSSAYLRSVYGNAWKVSLRATPYAGSIFSGWSGSCSGSALCQLTMSKSFWVGATFERAGGIVLTKTGKGRGSISSVPSGAACALASKTCTTWHRFGSVLTLTATAASGSRFTGWAGACSGNGKCVVRVTTNQDLIPVYAIFE